MIQVPLSVTDFNSILDNYAGQLMELIPITKTEDNVTGEETLKEGTTAQIKCYFVKTSQQIDFEKAGLIIKGEGIALIKAQDHAKKDDKLKSRAGELFRIQEAFDVNGTFDSASLTETSAVYTVCGLFLDK